MEALVFLAEVLLAHYASDASLVLLGLLADVTELDRSRLRKAFNAGCKSRKFFDLGVEEMAFSGTCRGSGVQRIFSSTGGTCGLGRRGRGVLVQTTRAKRVEAGKCLDWLLECVLADRTLE